MPSVSVPLKADNVAGPTLMKQRREFWAKGDNNHPDRSTSKHGARGATDGSPCPITARPAMVKLCETFLEPMRAKFGPCLVLSGYRHVLYNACIGGARNSQHIYEEGFESVAADLRFGKGTPAQWAAGARGFAPRVVAGAASAATTERVFVHVDNRLYTADWSG